MSEQERSVLIARLLAAASVLGLSLGMAAASDQSNQEKFTTNDHKLDSNVHKGETGFLKHNSTQIKHPGDSVQHKHNIPSSELNPQPEPPFPPEPPITTEKPQKH